MKALTGNGQVPDELEGARIDKALAAVVPGLTRHLARKVLAMGGVFVQRGKDRRRVRRASEPVYAGDVLFATWHPEVLAPEKFELVVLHEDDDVVVIDKPTGQMSQGSELGDVGSLTHALMRRYGRDVRLMHRLDKGASGVMVAGRNPDATAALTPQFRNHTIERRYLAVTLGVPPDGECDVAIVQEGRVVRAALPGEPGMHAKSLVRVVSTFTTPVGASTSSRALVAVQLYTGRTHQIRIHLQSLGAPIIGDDEHGGPRAERLCLHAEVLGFVHPRGHALRFERALPEDFKRAAGLPEAATPSVDPLAPSDEA